MKEISFHSPKHRFVTIINYLFEIARFEFQQQATCDLFVAKENECTDFEWRCLQIYNAMRGLLNVMFSFNITLSLISKFPDDDYMHQYGYAAKGYALYHYSVICHKLSTINDLFFKITKEVCFHQLHEAYSWDDLKQPLKKAEYKEFVKVQKKFYGLIKTYLFDRNKSSHEGLVFNKLFNSYWMADYVTSHVSQYPDSSINEPKNFKFIRGTEEYAQEMERTTKQYVETLLDILKKVDEYSYGLFDVLEKLLLKDIDDILIDANLKCWNRVPTNTFDNIEKYLEEVINTQVSVYWHEPDGYMYMKK